MSVIAEFRLSPPEDALTAALGASGEMNAAIEDAVATDPDRPTFFLWARDGPFERFERTLSGNGQVEDVSLLDEVSDRRLYRVHLCTSPSIYRAYVERGAALLRATVTGEGWTMRLRFPRRESLVGFRRFCADHDLQFRLEELWNGDAGSSESALTAAQREALAAAHESGYFQVPRETSLAGVAERIGISPQATSERLRRAEEKLVSQVLDEQ